MTKRLMLLVAGSSIFFGAHAETKAVLSFQEMIERTFGDVYQKMSDALQDSCHIVQKAAQDIEIIAQDAVQDAAQECGSQITLHVNKHGGSLNVMTLNDGKDIPALALDGVKQLVQVIKPEQAAVAYIKLQKQIVDDFLVTLPNKIEQGLVLAEHVQDRAALIGPMMQGIMDAMREKELDLVIMKAALPQVVSRECEAAIMQCMQAHIFKLHGDMASTNFTKCVYVEPLEQELAMMAFDKEAFSDFFIHWMTDYCNGIVDALLTTLQKHYALDRTELGL